MSLDDVLSDPPYSRPNAGCMFGHWLHSLDEDKRESVRSAMEDPEWSGAALWRTLKEHVGGIKFGVDTLWRHRNDECACDRLDLR